VDGGRAQRVGSRWWVPGGPGPLLELPTRRARRNRRYATIGKVK